MYLLQNGAKRRTTLKIARWQLCTFLRQDSSVSGRTILGWTNPLLGTVQHFSSATALPAVGSAVRQSPLSSSTIILHFQTPSLPHSPFTFDAPLQSIWSLHLPFLHTTFTSQEMLIEQLTLLYASHFQRRSYIEILRLWPYVAADPNSSLKLRHFLPSTYHVVDPPCLLVVVVARRIPWLPRCKVVDHC